MRVVFIFLLVSSILFGMDKDLLRLEAKIYPKLVQLDRDLSKKLVQKEILFTILYEQNYFKDALYLKKLLEQKGYRVQLTSKLRDAPTTAYILAKKPTKKEFQTLLKTKRLIFSIDSAFLPYSTLGLYLGLKIKPYLNVQTLKKSDIKLHPIIFKVAKIYEKI